MSGSDAILFHQLVERVGNLEAELARLRERVEGKDMMDELGMPPPRRGPGRPPRASYAAAPQQRPEDIAAPVGGEHEEPDAA